MDNLSCRMIVTLLCWYQLHQCLLVFLCYLFIKPTDIYSVWWVYPQEEWVLRCKHVDISINQQYCVHTCSHTISRVRILDYAIYFLLTHTANWRMNNIVILANLSTRSATMMKIWLAWCRKGWWLQWCWFCGDIQNIGNAKLFFFGIDPFNRV